MLMMVISKEKSNPDSRLRTDRAKRTTLPRTSYSTGSPKLLSPWSTVTTRRFCTVILRVKTSSAQRKVLWNSETLESLASSLTPDPERRPSLEPHTTCRQRLSRVRATVSSQTSGPSVFSCTRWLPWLLPSMLAPFISWLRRLSRASMLHFLPISVLPSQILSRWCSRPIPLRDPPSTSFWRCLSLKGESIDSWQELRSWTNFLTLSCTTKTFSMSSRRSNKTRNKRRKRKWPPKSKHVKPNKLWLRWIPTSLLRLICNSTMTHPSSTTSTRNIKRTWLPTLKRIRNRRLPIHSQCLALQAKSAKTETRTTSIICRKHQTKEPPLLKPLVVPSTMRVSILVWLVMSAKTRWLTSHPVSSPSSRHSWVRSMAPLNSTKALQSSSSTKTSSLRTTVSNSFYLKCRQFSQNRILVQDLSTTAQLT